MAVGEAGDHDALGDAHGVCLAPGGLGYRPRRLIDNEVAEKEQIVIPDELRSEGFVRVRRRLSVRLPQEPRLGSRHVVGHDRHAPAPRRRRPIEEGEVESRPLSVDVWGEDKPLGVDGDRPCDRDSRRPLGRQGVSVERCSAVSGLADRLARLLRERAEKGRPNHDRDDAGTGDQDEAQVLFHGGNGFAGILVRLRCVSVGDRFVLARVLGRGRGRGLDRRSGCGRRGLRFHLASHGLVVGRGWGEPEELPNVGQRINAGVGRDVRPRDACLRRAGVRLASHGLVVGRGWSEPEELLNVGQGRQVRQRREIGQRRETHVPRGLVPTLARGEGLRPVGRGPAQVVIAHGAFVPHARAGWRGSAATAPDDTSPTRPSMLSGVGDESCREPLTGSVASRR